MREGNDKMNIVIASGQTETDFLIASFLEKKHNLVVINEDIKYCEYLASNHGIPVVHGVPYKKDTLNGANIYNYDVLIALSSSDSDNLAICQLAKKVYNIDKTVCVVSNPNNVNFFKQLGINTVISATYLVSNMIEQASTIENLISSLALENNKIILTDLVLDPAYPVCNKRLIDIKLPHGIIISCVLRNDDMIVPNGSTVLIPNDKLLIISSPSDQQKAIDIISGGKK